MAAARNGQSCSSELLTLDEAKIQAAQLEVLLLSRAYLYGLLHKVMGGEPTAELLEFLQSDITLDAIDEYAQENVGMASLKDFLKQLEQRDQQQLLEGIRNEYMNVFIGPFELPASPYEAPYTGSHDMALFQENTVVVREIYRSAGYQAKRLQRVPDDHVSLMLDFQALRAYESLKAFRRGEWGECANELREQGKFAQNHLADWLGIYAKAVRESAVGEGALLYPQMIEAADILAKQDVVFTAEASYWLELNGSSAQSTKPLSALEGAEDALNAVLALNLRGIEDNELVSL